jgi:hypothetical protein
LGCRVYNGACLLVCPLQYRLCPMRKRRMHSAGS